MKLAERCFVELLYFVFKYYHDKRKLSHKNMKGSKVSIHRGHEYYNKFDNIHLRKCKSSCTGF